ncbi:MAG: cupin domain-containing protein [Desulfohalobiaceae bacterium]
MSRTSIGQRIKKLRQAREISRQDLAERANTAPEFIQELEEQDLYPSLGPLLKISRALGTRLGTFLDDQASQDPLLIRLEQRQQELSLLTGKNQPEALRFYSLGKGKTDRHMEPFFIQVLPESALDKRLSSHEGEEFIVVVSGELELLYNDQIHHLQPGDSIYYNSIVPHCVSCRGDQPAEIYAVLYLPQ